MEFCIKTAHFSFISFIVRGRRDVHLLSLAALPFLSLVCYLFPTTRPTSRTTRASNLRAFVFRVPALNTSLSPCLHTYMFMLNNIISSRFSLLTDRQTCHNLNTLRCEELVTNRHVTRVISHLLRTRQGEEGWNKCFRPSFLPPRPSSHILGVGVPTRS